MAKHEQAPAIPAKEKEKALEQEEPGKRQTVDEHLRGLEKQGPVAPPERRQVALDELEPAKRHEGTEDFERYARAEVAHRSYDSAPQPAMPSVEELKRYAQELPAVMREQLLHALADAHGARVVSADAKERRPTGKYRVIHQLKAQPLGETEVRLCKVSEVLDFSPTDIRTFTTLYPIALEAELV